MSEAFFKTLKWYVLMLFVMTGAALLIYADRAANIRWVMPGILSLGFAFILVYIWKELQGKLLFASLLIVVVMAYLAQELYAPLMFYALTGFDMYNILGYFWIWVSMVFVIGVPIMTLVFYKYGD